jgi:Peptidase propeptide and YPEB domain
MAEPFGLLQGQGEDPFEISKGVRTLLHGAALFSRISLEHIMRSNFSRFGMLLGTLALLGSHVAAQQHAQRKPRVALEVARATVLSRVAGEVRHWEVEYEGHRWIYSFEIKAGRPGIEEVNVDADTGVIVSVEHERG